MKYFCHVCNHSTDGRLRNGIVACQACKSFFIMNIGKDLHCKTGRFDCQVAIDIKTSIVDSNGNVWRLSCTACRFNRCIQAGMKIKVSNAAKYRSSTGSYDGVPETSVSWSLFKP